MAGKFWLWSVIAANNASADPTVNFAEGQAPSSVNDSMRAVMASLASYRIDKSGTTFTGGTSTAYTLTTSQAFASAADMDGQEFTFLITPTNGAGATLNVNGIGAFPLMFANGGPMPAGSLVDGSIYTATFFNSASIFRVQSYFGNPFNIPIAGMMDWIAPAVPNSSFVFPIGQAISRVTYATLFGLVGTTYGVGDGSTTFNVPDLTGRVTAMKEASASRLTSTYFGGNSTVLGAVGGLESHTLTSAEIPAHTHPNTLTDLGHTHNWNQAGAQGNVAGTGAPLNTTPQYGTTGTAGPTNNSAPMSITNANNTGGGGGHAIVQPTLIVNKILRII